MINLRYHIVSIVAVFLALAVGIVTGSTLLDRTILDGLEARQNSLDRRNDELKALADDYEQALNESDSAASDVTSDGVDAFDPTFLAGSSVLVIASKGVDAGVVAQLGALVDRMGARPLGTLWAGDAIDLTDEEIAAEASAAWWGPEGVPTLLGPVDALVGGIAEELSKIAAITDPDATTTTSTTSPEPAVTPAEGDDAASIAANRFRRLIDGGFLEWDPAPEARGSAFTLTSSRLVTVVLGGEDAEMGPVRFLYPLVDAMVVERVPVVVGEVHRPRFATERIKDDEVLPRGFVVDRFRQQADSDEVVTTVDNVDHPFGRLAVALSMRNGRLPAAGAYGMGDLADAMFPTE